MESLVDEIRRTIKDRIASGKVKFIIRSEASDEDKGLSLLTILANHDGYEAVVADDRYLNKFNNSSSQPIISSLEIIRFLHENAYISEQDFICSLQKLRRAGAIFVPFAKQELVDAATKSHSQNEKSKELIELIEYLCFIGKSDVIKYPEEFYFITAGIHSCARAIKEIWAAELNTDVAREKSKYLVELINSFYLCIPTNEVSIYRQLSDNIAATIVATLADIDFSSDAITGASYFKFLDDTIIKDDRYSRKYIFPYVGKIFAGTVENVTCNIHSQNNAIPLDLIAKSCVARIHPIIQRVMLEDADFSKKYDLVNKTIQICGHEINYEDFMEYVRSVANNKRSVLHSIDEKRLNIVASKIQDGTIQLKLENVASELKAGCILASSKKSRKKVLDAIKKEYDFSRMLYQKWKKKIITELTNSEYWELLDDINCLPLVALDNIDRAISTTGALDFELCIPSSEETFLALFGEPTQRDMDAFFYAAAPWQSKILLSDIDAGILKIGPGALVPSKRLLDICITSKKVFSVEALANCVSKYKDPFSLMLIFDICAALSQTDGRYVAVGEDVIHKVLRSESANEFIDFEISLHFVLPLLLQKVTLKDYSLFFQRLCAWGWAGYISRILGHYDFDRAAVLAQLKETQRNTFLITGLVERQGSPYWHPNYISSSHLSGFLYNRIISSIETFCHASTPNEWDTLLRGSENKGEISNSTLYSFYPTPFTGLSKHYGEPQSIEDISEQINKNFSELPRDEFLQTVIPFAQLFKFTSDNLDCIEMACVSLKNSLALISDDDFLNILDGLNSAAAANRAEMIAPPIADWFITRSIEQDKKGEEFLATYTILSTFVAYQDKMEAYKFLSDKLTAIAFISKDRVQIKRSLSALKQIEEAFPELRPYLLKPKTIFTLGYYAN